MKSIFKIAVVLTAIIGGDTAAAFFHSRCVWEENLGDHIDNSASCYQNDKKHGKWENRYATGRIDTGPYVAGKKHGRWKVQFADGRLSTGPYVNDKAHGRWEYQLSGGRVKCGLSRENELVHDSIVDGPCK